MESISHDELALCTCGGTEFTARDAIDAAFLRGAVDRTWREFLRRMRAESRADELEMELDDDAVDGAAESFRYQHDLITAEETEQWLTARGLALDDFTDYFSRQYCLSALDDEIQVDDVSFASATREQRAVFTAELILSGELDHFSNELMWRLAARSAASKEESLPERISAEREEFLKKRGLTEAELTNWLASLGRDSDWFDQFLLTEAIFQERCQSILDPQTRKREMAMLRMPLTRFEAEVIEVESLDAAKEVLFCIRQDGMSMPEVAAEARYPFHTVSFLQEDVSEDLQQKVLSVAVGDVLEPFPHGDGFELYRITQKVEPQLDDPAVQQKIDQRLLNRHFSELTAKYVEPRLPTAAG